MLQTVQLALCPFSPLHPLPAVFSLLGLSLGKLASAFGAWHLQCLVPKAVWCSVCPVSTPPVCWVSIILAAGSGSRCWGIRGQWQVSGSQWWSAVVDSGQWWLV